MNSRLDFLKGYRTIIMGWIMALAPVAAKIGYDIDPVAIGSFLQEFGVWIAGGYVLGGGLVQWFRGLANK